MGIWQQWVNAILGLWVIAVPFTGLAGSALMWVLVITGIVVAVLGAWGAVSTQNSEVGSSMRHAHS